MHAYKKRKNGNSTNCKHPGFENAKIAAANPVKAGMVAWEWKNCDDVSFLHKRNRNFHHNFAFSFLFSRIQGFAYQFLHFQILGA